MHLHDFLGETEFPQNDARLLKPCETVVNVSGVQAERSL